MGETGGTGGKIACDIVFFAIVIRVPAIYAQQVEETEKGAIRVVPLHTSVLVTYSIVVVEESQRGCFFSSLIVMRIRTMSTTVYV